MRHTIITLILCLPIALLCQCGQFINVESSILDSFSCRIKFDISFTTDTSYQSATAIIKHCGSTNSSNTVEAIENGETLNFEIIVEGNCGCSLYEPVVIFTQLEEDGSISNIQCSANVISYLFAFERCPNINWLDEQIQINGVNDCVYSMDVALNFPQSMDRATINVSNCDGFIDMFSIEQVNAYTDYSFQLDFSNNCQCPELTFEIEMEKAGFIDDCKIIFQSVEFIDFFPYPLELENFTLRTEASKLFAEWKTLIELNLSSFTIQYSEDGVNFDESIYYTEAFQVPYSYSQEIENRTGYYRLLLTNQSGEIGISEVEYYESTLDYYYWNGILQLNESSKIEIYNIAGQKLFSDSTDQIDLNTLQNQGLLIIQINESQLFKIFL